VLQRTILFAVGCFTENPMNFGDGQSCIGKENVYISISWYYSVTNQGNVLYDTLWPI